MGTLAIMGLKTLGILSMSSSLEDAKSVSDIYVY